MVSGGRAGCGVWVACWGVCVTCCGARAAVPPLSLDPRPLATHQPAHTHPSTHLLAGDGEGYKLYTMDHDNGELRLDLQQRWDAPTPPKVCAKGGREGVGGRRPDGRMWGEARGAPEPGSSNPDPDPNCPPSCAAQPIVHEDDLICDPTAGWLCSQVECEVR